MTRLIPPIDSDGFVMNFHYYIMSALIVGILLSIAAFAITGPVIYLGVRYASLPMNEGVGLFLTIIGFTMIVGGIFGLLKYDEVGEI